MSRASLPPPADLGVAWRYFVDPGSGEDGYLGNGTPVMARQVPEVVEALTAAGCGRAAGATGLPRPAHALEARYRHASRGVDAVAVALEFPTGIAAAAFWSRHHRDLRACAVGRPRHPGDTRIDTDESDTTVSLRVSEPGTGGTYRETAVHIGQRIMLLSVADPDNALTRSDLPRRLRQRASAAARPSGAS